MKKKKRTEEASKTKLFNAQKLTFCYDSTENGF